MTETSVPTRPRRAGRRSGRRSKSTALFIRDIIIIFLVALLASVLIKTFLVRSFYIPSGSMQNTLQINDRILVNELEPNLMPIQRGDVVVFKDPGGWLPAATPTAVSPIKGAINWALDAVGLAASDSNDHLIKRVIGLPGDHIACCNALGQMMVNDVPLNEPYLKLPAGVTKVSDIAFDVTVPAGSLWVMGDNRYNSADSRYNQTKPGGGFVPVADVVGRALWITWPIGRWSYLDDYPAVFQAAKDAAPGPPGGSG
ncbi:MULTISPECIES: signal peptidase I [Subtercola]|uniref:Signal peptidase I n=1 Tax=Subtercola vilae TaxID=2056433 RepID=A0A4T2C7G6_9MICO|nr:MULTISPECIES: signal peptidase I [Subtercola]MEA9985684.1 signal peptidase I [Subtercola sp. RTI3]TIH38258.1 signal peptidase I [Subtercola vilae]